MTKKGYRIELAGQVHSYLQSLTPKVREKVAEAIDLLSSTPFFGRKYEPEYEAASAPLPCRYFTVPKTYAQLYYIVDEEASCVIVVWAGDSRMDPRNRFCKQDPGSK